MDEVVIVFTKLSFPGWLKLLEVLPSTHGARDNFQVCLWKMPQEVEKTVRDSLERLSEGFTRPVAVNGVVFQVEPADLHPGLYREGWLDHGERVLCFKVKKEKRET